MGNGVFPNTTLQPIQTLDFILEDGRRIRVMLLPIPDSQRSCIADVNIQVTNAGCTFIQRVRSSEEPFDLISASRKAWEFVSQEAESACSKLVEVRIEGEEFVTMQDVEDIVDSSIKVVVV